MGWIMGVDRIKLNSCCVELVFYLADPATHPSRIEAIHSSKMFSLVKSLALPLFGNGGCFFLGGGGGCLNLTKEREEHDKPTKLKVNLHFE